MIRKVSHVCEIPTEKLRTFVNKLCTAPEKLKQHNFYFFQFYCCILVHFNHIANRKAKIVYIFGLSECNRVKIRCHIFTNYFLVSIKFTVLCPLNYENSCTYYTFILST